MKKFQQIKMEEEYWYALGHASEVMNFNSRHDLVVTILKTWVETQASDSLKFGIEKMQFLESRKVTAEKDYKKMASVIIDHKSYEYTRRVPIKLFYRDGRVLETEAVDVMEAFKLLEGDFNMTKADYDKLVANFEYIKG